MLSILSVLAFSLLIVAGGWRFGVRGGLATGVAVWALFVSSLAVFGEIGGDFYSVGVVLTLIWFVFLGLAGALFERVIRG